MKHVAIILAGGSGTRMGGAMPKQFLSLKDKPVIVHTLEKFQQNENIDAILIVCIKDWIEHLKEILDEFKIPKVKWIVEGGPFKQSGLSVKNKFWGAGGSHDNLG